MLTREDHCILSALEFIFPRYNARWLNEMCGGNTKPYWELRAQRARGQVGKVGGC
jgi:hypothetical protein